MQASPTIQDLHDANSTYDSGSMAWQLIEWSVGT